MHEAFTLAFVDYRFTGAFSFRRSRQIEVPKHTNPDNGQSTQATYYTQDEFARVMRAAKAPPWNT